MRYTWNLEQLKNINDLDFAIAFLNESYNKRGNPFSPLSEKLKSAIKTLEKIKEDRGNAEN